MIVRSMFLRSLIITIVLSFLAFQETAYADLDLAVASKPYQVSFVDWVVVYLSTKVGKSTEDYWVSVGARPISNKVRFVVVGTYTDTVTGRQWYETIGSKIEQFIATQCKIWTGEGHPISSNDFEITIRKIAQR